MVTENGIQTYVCSEKKVHSGRTTQDQCTWVDILRIIEWILGPKAKNDEGIRRPRIMR